MLIYTTGFEYIVHPNTLNTAEANRKINKWQGFSASSDFFSMLSFPLLQGTPQTSLSTTNSIAVSRRMAEQFFENAEQAINKTILPDNKEEYSVSAVFENLPSNTSFKFDFLLPGNIL